MGRGRKVRRKEGRTEGTKEGDCKRVYDLNSYESHKPSPSAIPSNGTLFRLSCSSSIDPKVKNSDGGRLQKNRQIWRRRERERETQRERDRQRERQRERETEKERQRERCNAYEYSNVFVCRM